MKRTLFFGLSLALMATVVAAADSRLPRSGLAAAVAPIVLGQPTAIPMPAPLSPVPDPAFSSQAYTPGQPYQTLSPPLGDPAYGIPSGITPVGGPVELFTNVKYRATRNIAPCAVPTIVQVADPCNKDRCCKSC